jgi:hypothetical protein
LKAPFIDDMQTYFPIWIETFCVLPCGTCTPMCVPFLLSQHIVWQKFPKS